MRTSSTALLSAALLGLWAAGGEAQSFRRAGTEFGAKRPVNLPAGKSYPVVVTEFLHHGQIRPDGKNVAVFSRNQRRVALRILQLGPGDFCRLAFQTLPAQREYDVFYGGDPPNEEAPPWTNRDGLLLETRRYKHCNPTSLDSVRQAFAASKPYGSDYVENVQHSRNPFSLKVEPFLSKYSGYLDIPSDGTYGFIASSRDAGFLLIDENLVTSARGVLSAAKPGSRKDVRLTAGPHKFEYYHVAAGPRATMVAAWEVNPSGQKPMPAAIPSDAFHTRSIGRLPAGYPALRTTSAVPDFLLRIAGDVPLPDNALPLIGVLFRDASPKALTMKAKPRWDFGDGQTSDKLQVDHVYLRPGLYTVKYSLKRATRVIEMTNRVYVDRAALTRKDADKLHSLDDYLPILETYNPRTLDAVSLRQLVLAYEAKALALRAQAEEELERARAAAEDPNRSPESVAKPVPPRPTRDDDPNNPKRYILAAVTAGKVAFLEESAARGNEDLHRLAATIGPMARDQLGDSPLAGRIWRGASQRIHLAELKADAQLEAADIALNDLVDAATAKTLLDSAAKHLEGIGRGPTVGKLQRVWGDYHALSGNGEAARKAYLRAQEALGFARRFHERTAWRGAHSRSVEAFLREGQYERAAAEIRAWQREFPTEKIDGYLTLMYAKYFAGRKLFVQAVAQAEQLQTVNPDSPCMDQLLLLAADCEAGRGRVDRALAFLHSLVNDYPGSPRVPEAKQRIARLEPGQGG